MLNDMILQKYIMKLLIKILLFVFVVLIVNVRVMSAAITFPNIQETTTSFSFHKETSKIVSNVDENDIKNCCQNGRYLVDYRNWVQALKYLLLRREVVCSLT